MTFRSVREAMVLAPSSLLQRRLVIVRLAVLTTVTAVVGGSATLGVLYAHRQATISRAMILAIHDRFGGSTKEERLLKVEFISDLEYRALKRTPDGHHVWLHISLSKLHCGNWTINPPEHWQLIRPYEVRYPERAGQMRGGGTCF